jgi:predicted small lipoprotein YifL
MKKLISLSLAAVLMLSMAACSGKSATQAPPATATAAPTANAETAATATPSPTEAAEAPPVADTNPLTMLTQGHYVYSFYAEGYGNYTYFLHFYPEAPVLGAVFYAGFSNNGVKFAGTYTVEEKEKAYACFPDRDAAIVTDGVPVPGVAPYTITFFDFDGNEIESCGYDGEVLYNDLVTIAGVGSAPLQI